MIAEDLDKISGQQAVLQSQVDAQTAMSVNTESTLFDYQALDFKILTLVNDFPEVEKRVRDL
jgi:hypothetical protein